MYKSFVKRILDLFFSILGLIILFFPMLVIALAIRIDSKGPVFFKQKRLGKNKKLFIIYKFRTMCDHAYENGGIASNENDIRITKVGKFLRRTSIDEIPQLINVLFGQMSIIGPRPILDWEYEEFANPKFESRFSTRPGMFCTVDIIYRASATRELQFQMDAEYAENLTFKIDAKTFFKIFKTVFGKKNVYKDENKENKNE